MGYKNSNQGFTLIELLTVSAIVVVIAGLIMGVLYSTLRGSSKSRATNDVSQNGNYALSIISNTALLAESVTKVGSEQIADCTTRKTGSSIEFKQPDGLKVTFVCDGASESIASTSGSTTYPLVNNSAVKIPYNTCSFTCFQSDSNPYSLPIIGVTFTVTQRSNFSSVDQKASSTFKTSVTMRNFSPK